MTGTLISLLPHIRPGVYAFRLVPRVVVSRDQQGIFWVVFLREDGVISSHHSIDDVVQFRCWLSDLLVYVELWQLDDEDGICQELSVRT